MHVSRSNLQLSFIFPFQLLIFQKEIVSFLFQLKEFILSQAEAYEFKIGDKVFRRPGDPPLDQVLEKLQKEKNHKSQEEL
jgi:hypothetical protein